MDDLPRYLAVIRSALARARQAVVGHPAVSLGAAGFLAGWLTVIAGGRVGTVRSVIPITDWLGLMSREGHRSGDYLPGSLMLVGIVIMVVLWMVAIRSFHAGRTSERHVWGIGAAWAAPFVIGPPLLSNDVFTYAAQGMLVRNGLDPYHVGPSALGNVPAVAAVDPSWRSVPSPYGPLATTLQHLGIAISGGDPLGATIVFRALGVLCLVAIGLLAAELAGPRRVQALTMTVLNPLLLLQVVSAAHLDGVMCVLLLAAIVAGNQRKWVLAIVLAAAAGSIKAPAYLGVLVLIAMHQSFRARLDWRALARDAAVAVASVGGFSLLVHDGWGWVHALDTPALGHTALAPASLIGDMFDPLVPSASFDDLSAGGRISALILAGCVVAYLTFTAGSRALDRSIGYGMLAVGVLSPVVYPWYLLGGVACLAPAARGARRDWMVVVSAIGCLLTPPGFNSDISNYLSISAVGVCLLVVVPRELARHRERREQLPSVPGARLLPVEATSATTEAITVPAPAEPAVTAGG